MTATSAMRSGGPGGSRRPCGAIPSSAPSCSKPFSSRKASRKPWDSRPRIRADSAASQRSPRSARRRPLRSRANVHTVPSACSRRGVFRSPRTIRGPAPVARWRNTASCVSTFTSPGFGLIGEWTLTISSESRPDGEHALGPRHVLDPHDLGRLARRGEHGQRLASLPRPGQRRHHGHEPGVRQPLGPPRGRYGRDLLETYEIGLLAEHALGLLVEPALPAGHVPAHEAHA